MSRNLRKIETAVSNILHAEQLLTAKPSRSQERYEMAESTKRRLAIGGFIREHRGDPAVMHFWERLRDFFITRLRGCRYDGEDTTYSNEERHRLQIKDDVLYQHSHIRINYTTYDVRRAQDSVSLRTSRCDIMVPANDAKLDHPFWYARVLGIFHAFVREEGDGRSEEWSRIDVLWVRWFGLQGGSDSRTMRRLRKVGFVPLEDDGAFGFIHPEEVIRASHIVPAFAHGIEEETIGHSFVQDRDGDYNYYYIMKFVDRDMYMRYRGGGIGHVDPLVRRTSTSADEDQSALASSGEDALSDIPEELGSQDGEDSDTNSETDSENSSGLISDRSEETGSKGDEMSETET